VKQITEATRYGKDWKPAPSSWGKLQKKFPYFAEQLQKLTGKGVPKVAAAEAKVAIPKAEAGIPGVSEVAIISPKITQYDSQVQTILKE